MGERTNISHLTIAAAQKVREWRVGKQPLSANSYSGIFPGYERDVELIPELLVLAFPCGTYSSQRNWSFDLDANTIKWGHLCLSTYNCNEQGLPKQQPWWRAHLGKCVTAETQKWWYGGTEIHAMGHRNAHNPNGDDRCLETRGKHGHGPAVGMSRCIHPNRIASAFGVDAIVGGFVHPQKEYRYSNGEMIDGNGLCLDVWHLPNCSADGKMLNSSDLCIDQWRLGQSVGTQLQDLREFVSLPARIERMIVKVIALLVVCIVITLLRGRISSMIQKFFSGKKRRDLHPTINPTTLGDDAEMAMWSPLADDPEFELAGNFA